MLANINNMFTSTADKTFTSQILPAYNLRVPIVPESAAKIRKKSTRRVNNNTWKEIKIN